MKNTAIFLMLSALSFVNVAHADGFVCETANTGLHIKIYNHTDSAQGTRTPSIMILSDPSRPEAEQTITAFRGENQTLTYQGYGSYLGKVDLRYTETTHAGLYIAGTRLSDLKTIEAAIKFSYDSATTVLAQTVSSIPGKMAYTKRTGEVMEEALNCKRYLKN